ncbi:hypothetical protein [Cytobacillus oceanisediminis]|uniref:hypothetical protein n=1 Tax=Cytobacillus oceanisediminis TaxID=665099 RepID=UPI001FB1FBEF|nr:hypothetical protein [Cytobacillus oceanisediminis]UOE58193.1 hypothetical protein IRB79_27200 [Cytobacillus oceanisediminis]
MKYLIIFLSIIVLAGCGDTQAGGSSKSTFRDTYWGMTQEEVKEAADTSMNFRKESDEFIYYNGTLNKEDVDIVFEFDKGKLISAWYSIENGISDEDKSPIFVTEGKLENFESDIIEQLEKKYGKPKELEGEDEDTRKYLQFEDKDTVIEFNSHDSYFLKFVRITYSSKEHIDQIKEDKEKGIEEEL